MLVRNFISGLDAVPAEARAAADGMGFSNRQRVLRVELPLALPAIMAGVRLATVSTIGLVTVSAGNHAQAVAWAARIVEAPCTVVMPTDAPRSKIDAVRGYGARVVLHDDRATVPSPRPASLRLVSGNGSANSGATQVLTRALSSPRR